MSIPWLKDLPNAKFCMECGKELPMLNLDKSENKSENTLLNDDKKDTQQNKQEIVETT